MKNKLLKVALTTFAAVGLSVSSFAQAPAQCEDVMLQAFYWDSQNETKWAKLQPQSQELAETFTLIWLPPSGKGNGVGYIQDDYSNQNSSWGSVSELKNLISSFHQHGSKVIADIVINHRGGCGPDCCTWCTLRILETLGSLQRRY